MRGGDSDQVNAVIDKLIRKHLIKGLGQGELPNARFDCNFPQARDAEKFLVGLVFNQRTGLRAERLVANEEPQERMRIEQEPHHMYSSKSFSGSSKSSEIVISPLPLPNLGRGFAFSIGTSLTLWRSSLLMTISSPLTAASIRSGKWSFASSTLTCCI